MWTYDKTKEAHTYIDGDQDYTWTIKMKKKEDYEFVLSRTWQLPGLIGQVDYIGTFEKLATVKQVADLIRSE